MPYDRHTRHEMDIESSLRYICYRAVEGQQSKIIKEIRKLKKLKLEYVHDSEGNYYYQDKYGDKYDINMPKVKQRK